MVRTEVLKAVLLITGMLIHDKKIISTLTDDETLIKLTNHVHILEPLLPTNTKFMRLTFRLRTGKRYSTQLQHQVPSI